jgi:hypothetical protein
MKKIKIGSNVVVDGIKCVVEDIATGEDMEGTMYDTSKVWYGVRPTEFEITLMPKDWLRYVTIDKIK